MAMTKVGAIAGVMATVLVAAHQATAMPFAPDSVLVSAAPNQIREYGPTGALIRTIVVPYPVSPAPTSERVRDFVITESGQLAVFNGTFDPCLSVYDPGSGTWRHETFPGWSTGNNARYGGIATVGPYVFVSDASTSGDGGLDQLRGVIRFDTRDWSAVRFETQVGTHDVTVGLDGMLYAIGVGSTDTSLVKVFDPFTLSLVRTVTLAEPTEMNAIAVNAAGRIFGAGGVPNVNGVGGLYEFAPSGQLLRSIATPADSCRDIDLAPDGRLLFASRLRGVWMTDESWAQFQEITTPSEPYVAFPTYIPEPAALGLFVLGGLAAIRQRRRFVG